MCKNLKDDSDVYKELMSDINDVRKEIVNVHRELMGDINDVRRDIARIERIDRIDSRIENLRKDISEIYYIKGVLYVFLSSKGIRLKGLEMADKKEVDEESKD